MEYKEINNRMDSSLYQEEMEIRFCQCDGNHRLKLSELFRILTNIADMAFEYRGMDHQFLLEKQMAFLISRFSVLVYRMPVQIEKIRVATWEQSIEKAQFIRNFAVWDETGHLIIEATSGWILVNMTEHTIMRPAQFEEKLPGALHPQPENVSGAPAFIRLKLKENEERVQKKSDRKIVYSDIDGNGHVDNARYVDMVSDVLPDSLMSLAPKTAQIVFNREALLGETLQMYMKTDTHHALVKGKVDGKDSFICEIDFDESKVGEMK